MSSNLDLIVKDLNKKMKVGAISLGVAFQEVQKIPFSSCRLNYMTYGGIPIGRIAEFFGTDGSGKTTTAIDIAGQAQKLFPDKKVLFVDIEHTFDPVWATKLGLNCDDLLYLDPDSMGAEEVFNIIIDIIDSGEISLCILDSIGAMVSMQANEKEIGERTYGGISMALTEFTKKITPVLARTQASFIGINQARDDMNSPYGGTTTTGGKCWRHGCSTRLEFRKGNYIDEKGNNLSRACENPAGNIVNVSLIKSKVVRPDRKVGFYTLKYLEGIDYISDAVDVAIKLGLVNQAGAWFTLIEPETGEVKEKFQGKPKLVEYLKDNIDAYTQLSNDIQTLLEEE
uniref:Protein recA n=1 Tax=Siphoviridae sp. ctwDi18 TaxID=2827970 RepID=A0A8S5TA28_9CAUD|nr:MAG TPA: Protein recA [Siphoviridae sp. ctwDi18]